MFESINNFLNNDSEKQSLIEKNFSKKISEVFLRNKKALIRTIPGISDLINKTPSKYELILNGSAKLNIVLKSEGALLYGHDPIQEAHDDVQYFIESTNVNNIGRNSVLVIIGIGLGHHLLPLLTQLAPKYVLIYEPEPDFLLLSLRAAAWFETLTLCQTEGITLFLQLQENAFNLVSDLAELKHAFPEALAPIFYQHLYYPKLAASIQQYKSGKIDNLVNNTLVFLPTALRRCEYNNVALISSQNEQETKEHNLLWLSKHAPESYQQLHEYAWQQWKLIKYHDHYGMQNAYEQVYSLSFNKQKKGCFFNQSALLDPIVFEYSLPKKFMNIDFAELFTGIKNVQQRLISKQNTAPLFVRERILLGTADYNACAEAIVNSKMLIVLETDPDFLYASLLTVPWHKFEGPLFFCRTAEELETLITSLFQQNILGLTDVFIDHPYYEQGLRQVYHSLTELIQANNGKSNYFEKQFSSLKHFFQNQQTSYYLTESKIQNDTPVFIIGNGPSLDTHIAFLQQYRQKFLLVSCGTALITLYRNGLKPNYHLELERGISTLSYLQNIPTDYLQQITLVSPADQHPEVIKAFKKAFLTLVSNNDLTDLFSKTLSSHNLLQLTHSYYTVTNFAVDFFLSIGCNLLYLLGIDFGFKHIKAHHASSSVYFRNDGSELYDFELTHGTAYEVAANFGGSCLTVPPFDIARKLMARRISMSPQQRVYNCNDGAYINSAIPLKMPVFTEASYNVDDFCLTIESLFMRVDLNSESIDAFDQISQQTIKCFHAMLYSWEILSKSSLLEAIAQQRHLLDDVKYSSSLPTYLLIDGSLRYFEMVSTRLVNSCEDNSFSRQLTTLWQTYLSNLINKLEQ